MQERDNNLSKTTEQEAAEMLDLIRGTEFGSTVYQAVSDYLKKSDLDHSIHIYRDNAFSHPEDPKHVKYWESELRIEEIKMALLDNEIRQKEVIIPGYSNYYYGIAILDEELHDVGDYVADKFIEGVSNAIHEIRASSYPSDNAS